SGLRAGSRIIKVMINGTEVSFRPDLNAFLGPEYIPIDMVERIEVARGPLSALYGANAFLATVNVITVDPRETAGTVSVASTVRPKTGTDGAWRTGLAGSAVVAGRLNDQIRAIIGATYEHTDRGGLTITNTYPAELRDPNNFVGRTSGQDLARPVSVMARIMASSARLGNFSLQGGLQQTDSSGEFQLNSILTGGSRRALRNIWSKLTHEGQWNDRLSSSLSVGYAHGAPTSSERLLLTNDTQTYFTRNFDYDAVDAHAGLTFRPWARLRLVGNVDLARERHAVLFYNQHYLVSDGVHNVGDTVQLIPDGAARNINLTTVAPNLHASFDPLDGIRVSADGRWDVSNLFSRQFSWRAAVGWRITPHLVIKAIAGRAFQAPSTAFLFSHPGFGFSDTIGSRNIAGAPPLVPQVIRSVETVVNYVYGTVLSVNAAVYAQSILEQITVASTGAGYAARNQDAPANSLGAEVNLTGRMAHVEPYLRVSRQWFDTTSSPLARGPQTPPPFIPATWAMAGLRMSALARRLVVTGTWRWVGVRGASQNNAFLNDGIRYTLPSYQQVDITGSFALKPYARYWETRIVCGIHNLLDTRRVEPGFGGIDVPGMGRSVSLALVQSF
ncbi:MAG: TonB-dependent receptor, partial [Deltaproteobacteria bacterium]|nr:TonB-dependent receptor [Deltaproteobacteria bacterium]